MKNLKAFTAILSFLLATMYISGCNAQLYADQLPTRTDGRCGPFYEQTSCNDFAIGRTGFVCRTSYYLIFSIITAVGVVISAVRSLDSVAKPQVIVSGLDAIAGFRMAKATNLYRAYLPNTQDVAPKLKNVAIS